MPSFENQCSELSKAQVIAVLGVTLDERKELLAVLSEAAVWAIAEGASAPWLAKARELLAQLR